MESRYEIHLRGEKSFSWFAPSVKIKNAAFIWDDQVELVSGDFQVSVDPLIWLRRRIWSMQLTGDGAKLRFLGDWLKKAGVEEVKTTRLRLALDFSDDGIQDIHTVEILAPDYQFQIQSRIEPKA
jgi:hypothetical protein